GGTDFPRGTIKGHHGWIGIGSFPIGINRTAVPVIPLTLIPKATVEAGDAFRLVWHDTGTVHRWIQQATDGQSLIPYNFCWKPRPCSAGQKLVIRILF